MTRLRAAVLSPTALSSPFFLSLIPILLSILSYNNAIVAAQDGATITLSFLDEESAIVGQPQSILYGTCIPLAVQKSTDPEVPSFTIAKATDLRAALNLYSDQFCQQPLGSSVGQWTSEGYAAETVSVRWEGTADANLPTGVYRPESFPNRMYVQPKITPNPNQFVLDHTKGKILVGSVSVALAIGVMIGIYQVYQASLYEAPPKEPKKEKKKNVLNVKKVKKKDAYYRKPIRQNPELTSSELPLLSPAQAQARIQAQAQAKTLPSPSPLSSQSQSQSQMVERRGFRNNHVLDTGSVVTDWNKRNQNNNGSDSVVIDMQGTISTATTTTAAGVGGVGGVVGRNRENTSFSNSNNKSRGIGEVVLPMQYISHDNNNYSNYSKNSG